MTVVVYILGAVLVLAGAVIIGMGVPIVRLEIGWSEVIGGAVAGSAGFVIVALGVVLARLEAMHRSILAMQLPVALRGSLDADDERADAPPLQHPIPMLIHPLAPVPEPLAPEPDRPVYTEPTMTEAVLHDARPAGERVEAVHHDVAEPDLAEGAPAFVDAESEDLPPLPPPVTAVEPIESAVPPEPLRPRSSFMAAFLARRSAGLSQAEPVNRREDPLIEPFPSREVVAPGFPERKQAEDQFDWPEPAPTAPAGGGRGESFEQVLEAHEADDHEVRAADHATHGAHAMADADVIVESAEPPAVADDEATVSDPIVVGRYNAGSASYVMYSNGMIEVETDTGTHRFASMQELKAFIERRDSA